MYRADGEIVNICFPQNIDPYDSYGLLGCQLAKQLSRMGVYVNLFALGEEQLPSQDAELRKLVMQPVKPALGAIFLGYPTGFRLHENPLLKLGPQLGLTMFESSKLPEGWIKPMNQMDHIFTPTNWGKKLFEDGGVNVPITVTRLGLNPAYRIRKRPAERSPITFLTFIDRGKRKGGIAATNAFIDAFADDPNVKLIIKGRRAKIKLGFINPNIETIQQDMTEDELADLYARCDVLVNPNMGEGFGLIPREFAATGGIALATNWSGTGEDLERWGWGLPYELVKADWRGARHLEGTELGEWAKPDIKGVTEVLKHVRYNISSYKEEAEKRAKSLPSYYSWEKYAEIILKRWRNGNCNTEKQT
jgi:glycosyltransferase involved in cell wall biosynthesis